MSVGTSNLTLKTLLGSERAVTRQRQVPDSSRNNSHKRVCLVECVEDPITDLGVDEEPRGFNDLSCEEMVMRICCSPVLEESPETESVDECQIVSSLPLPKNNTNTSNERNTSRNESISRTRLVLQSPDDRSRDLEAKSRADLNWASLTMEEFDNISKNPPLRRFFEKLGTLKGLNVGATTSTATIGTQDIAEIDRSKDSFRTPARKVVKTDIWEPPRASEFQCEEPLDLSMTSIQSDASAYFADVSLSPPNSTVSTTTPVKPNDNDIESTGDKNCAFGYLSKLNVENSQNSTTGSSNQTSPQSHTSPNDSCISEALFFLSPYKNSQTENACIRRTEIDSILDKCSAVSERWSLEHERSSTEFNDSKKCPEFPISGKYDLDRTMKSEELETIFDLDNPYIGEDVISKPQLDVNRKFSVQDISEYCRDVMSRVQGRQWDYNLKEFYDQALFLYASKIQTIDEIVIKFPVTIKHLETLYENIRYSYGLPPLEELEVIK